MSDVGGITGVVAGMLWDAHRMEWINLCYLVLVNLADVGESLELCSPWDAAPLRPRKQSAWGPPELIYLPAQSWFNSVLLLF